MAVPPPGGQMEGKGALGGDLQFFDADGLGLALVVALWSGPSCRL